MQEKILIRSTNK